MKTKKIAIILSSTFSFDNVSSFVRLPKLENSSVRIVVLFQRFDELTISSDFNFPEKERRNRKSERETEDRIGRSGFTFITLLRRFGHSRVRDWSRDPGNAKGSAVCSVLRAINVGLAGAKGVTGSRHDECRSWVTRSRGTSTPANVLGHVWKLWGEERPSCNQHRVSLSIDFASG